MTTIRAKPAIPLGGIPIIVRILQDLRAGGVTRVVVNLHHRPETITAVLGHGQALGMDVRYSWEPVLLGSAGGPRRASSLIDDDPFFIVNGDTLAAVDLRALTESHRTTGADVTLAVTPSPDARKYGGVLVGMDASVVEGFTRPGRAPRPPHLFLGVQLAHHRAFEGLPDGLPAESIWGHYPALLAARPAAIGAFPCRADFEDIGTLDDYLSATARRMPAEGVGFVGDRCQIAVGAHVRRSVLWNDVVLPEGASLHGCVVTDGVEVPAGRHYAFRLLMRNDEDPREALADIPLDSSWLG